MSTKLYTWNASRESIEILRNIASYLGGIIEEQVSVDDLSCMEESRCDNVIFFGSLAMKNSNISLYKNTWELPDASQLAQTEDNATIRKTTFAKLKAVAEYIRDNKQTQEKEIFVEVEDKKIGKINSDILITEEEARYLKQIRNLLGCGKMVITKGDIRIEIE